MIQSFENSPLVLIYILVLALVISGKCQLSFIKEKSVLQPRGSDLLRF